MLQIIVNPASKSGKGLQIWKKTETLLKKENINYAVFLTTVRGDATEFTQKCTDGITESLTILVLGGDGTLNEVIQGISNHDKVTIGYIPTGSGNDFARAMKLPRKRKLMLSHIIQGGPTRSVDLGIASYENHSRIFAVSCGIGFDAAVCEGVNTSTLKDKLNHIGLGKLTYLGIALQQIVRAGSVSSQLYIDNLEPVSFRGILFITAMVQPYEGGGFLFCPAADNSDGYIDVCAVHSLPLWKALCVLPTAFFGKHVSFKEVQIFKGKQIRISTASPLYFHTDGEVELKTTNVTVSNYAQKLKIIC